MTESIHSVDVIIPTYNAGNILQELLDSLSSQDYSGVISAIIVDSGSTDQTLKIIKSFTKLPIKLIQIDNKDFTHSYARNLGADKSRAEVLLFMTQDAVPEDNKWMGKMVSPLDEGYAAVSCAEDTSDCPDLFYRVSSIAYQKHIGIYMKDRIGCYKKGLDGLELKNNSSLNNLACCITRELFLNYKFRGEYAEDLDLGNRLIQDGKKIKIQGTVHVKHYHVRSPYYHLKRQYVECKAIAHILLTHERSISKGQLDWGVCQLYKALLEVESIIGTGEKGYMDLAIRLFLARQYLKILEIKKYSKEAVTKAVEIYRSDASFDRDVFRLLEEAAEGYNYNIFYRNAIQDIRGFFKYQMEPYILNGKNCANTYDIKKAMHKEAARLVGGLFSRLDSMDERYSFLEEEI